MHSEADDWALAVLVAARHRDNLLQTRPQRKQIDADSQQIDTESQRIDAESQRIDSESQRIDAES